MGPFADLADIVSRDEPMARHTSFGVGGPVSYFVEPRHWRELQVVYRRSWGEGLPVRVLGRGCNTLVSDGPHRWVVIATRRLRWFRRRGRRIDAGAGVDLPRLVASAEAWGMGGFESFAGIPGTVGGAVAMNAGGRHGSIADRLVGAVVAFPGEAPRWMDAGELGLGYRVSRVVGGRPFLFSASFELDRASPRRIGQRRRSIVAQKRATQPVGARSAGCVFKNPPGDSAGRLIDKAGLKGARVGDAVVSHKHANFIVNRGEATAADILALIELIEERVRETFGVRLELEIEVWTDDEERRRYGRA
ncbi:MAG: UDP-N-acetylmuramate dehydrogenase [Candidatus Brocadiia bacterium]